MIKSSLSANTLFHFTNSLDNLESILINEFYPKYSFEILDNIVGGEFRIAIPMVCFCDIPLSQIQEHAQTYGSYAIGLTKDWGSNNTINPVLYTHRRASTRNHMFDLLGQLSSTDSFNTIMNFMYFLKPYEGKLWRHGGLTKDINFYDEREWRYVPLIDKAKEDIERHLSPGDFVNERNRAHENEKLKSKKLSFEPNNIKYIIVKKESEIYDMILKIRGIKDKFPGKDVEILVTRIISMEHIREDF